MKTLLIMRHAKSDYPAHVASDFERPLNKRGCKDLPRMARLLHLFGPVPEVVLCSPATRAKETAEGLVAAWDGGVELRFDERLYLAPPAVLAQAACALPDAAETALVVAHNPGVEEWVGTLGGGQVVMPTAGLAALALDIASWKALDEAGGTLLWFVVPRLVKAVQL